MTWGKVPAVSVLVLGFLVTVAAAHGDLGVDPSSQWNCPPSHPIKGNFTTYDGEPCIYHVPGGYFYPRTKPERCYATEVQARADGCRKSKL